MGIEITYDGESLYHKYPGEHRPQDCYIEIDWRDGRMTAAYNPEIGNSVPLAVYHGHVERFRIPALRSPAVERLLEKLEALAERALGGYSVGHDSQGNEVAMFDGDSDIARREIRRVCEDETLDEQDQIVVYAAEDWFGVLPDKDLCDALGVSAFSSDELLERLAEEAQEQMTGGDLLEGALPWLKALRERMQDKFGEQAVCSLSADGLELHTAASFDEKQSDEEAEFLAKTLGVTIDQHVSPCWFERGAFVVSSEPDVFEFTP